MNWKLFFRNGPECDVPRLLLSKLWSIPGRFCLSICLSPSYLGERIAVESQCNQSVCIPVDQSFYFAPIAEYTTKSCSRASYYFSKLIKDFYKYGNNNNVM